MKKITSVLFMFCVLASLLFVTVSNKVYAEGKNEVTLNFVGATIVDGCVKYDGLGDVSLLKDDVEIDITNGMKIDLNEANYKFKVIKSINIGDPDKIFTSKKVAFQINNWYYGLNGMELQNEGILVLDTNKFNGELNIELVGYISVLINTKVENVYTDITSTGKIDLTNGKTFIIDFSKDDELTKGLKTFADLEKTIYYKKDNRGLLETENEDEAVIKIVGNEEENKAILSAVNVGDKKNEQFKSLRTKYTGSKLQFNNSVAGVVNETRTDYYTRCKYDFTFVYAEEQQTPKDYKFIEGANQVYTTGESKNAVFRVDGELEIFKELLVDNKLVDSKNYNLKSGSTIITLTDEYLKTLAVGEHSIKVTFTDDGEATTKFEIKEKQQNTGEGDNGNTGEENTGKDENGSGNEENNNANENVNGDSNNENTNENNGNSEENNGNVNKNSNPETGDNFITYVAIFAISVLGMATVLRSNKKGK